MPFADEYVVSAHPSLPLHSKVPRPWALDTYSTVIGIFAALKIYIFSLHSIPFQAQPQPQTEQKESKIDITTDPTQVRVLARYCLCRLIM